MWEDGTFYECNYRDGLRTGHGRDYCQGQLYEGEYEDDLPHGEGVLKFKNGDKYEGQFDHDKFKGHGVYTSSDGSVLHEGNFSDDHADM